MGVLLIRVSAVLVLLAFLAGFIFFLLEQERLLKNIRPENRQIKPGKVWLQLIPVYGLFFQFIVIVRLAEVSGTSWQ